MQLALVDSSGATCKQLVKSGSDDMRQDNVIRQFFELLTGLLQHNRATAKQGLRIRTYKVRSSRGGGMSGGIFKVGRRGIQCLGVDSAPGGLQCLTGPSLASFPLSRWCLSPPVPASWNGSTAPPACRAT